MVDSSPDDVRPFCQLQRCATYKALACMGSRCGDEPLPLNGNHCNGHVCEDCFHHRHNIITSYYVMSMVSIHIFEVNKRT